MTNLNPTTPPPPAPPASITTPRPKRRIRRQIDSSLVTGLGPGVLLTHEDADALQALRLSMRDRFNATSAVDLVLAELATAAAWRAIRNVEFECASIDTEVFDQTESVDREYEAIDNTSRAALIFHDPALVRVLRHFTQSANDCQRSLLNLLRNCSGGSSR